MFPFLATRAAWILVGLFAAGSYLPNPTYAHYVEQGGFLSRYWLIDVFSRWDSKWYLSIARDGYTLNADPAQVYTNLAFFPLYPYLARGAGWLGIQLPDSLYLLSGLLISNLCFLAACVLLYRLAVRHLGFDDSAARRALGLLFAFPTAFIFSSFYTESLFLLIAAAGFTAAFNRRWALAGLAAALAVLTRSQGVLVAAALGWVYMEARGWRWRSVRADVLWFGLAPAALLAHLTMMQIRFGRFFGPMEAMAAWGRGQYGFWEGLWLNISGPSLDVFKIDALLAVGFLACGVYLFIRGAGERSGSTIAPPDNPALPGRWRALGLLAVLLCLMPIATGLLVSVSRYISVAFPVYLLLARRLDRPEGYNFLRAVWFALQIAYWVGWVNYYWIV